MTNHKELLLNIIYNSKEHLNADQVFWEAKKTQPSIALGTIYRNLGLLVKEKKINKIILEDSSYRYDKNTKNHDHLICTVCNKIYDFEIYDFKKYIEEKTNVKIDSYSLNIKFICDECINLKKLEE